MFKVKYIHEILKADASLTKSVDHENEIKVR
jgi:hypothetical protein